MGNKENDLHHTKLLDIVSDNLRRHMAGELSPSPEGRDDRTVMNEQAALLDLAFRALVASGRRYNSTSCYLAAFKAQNQCRYTMHALNRLKDKGSDTGKNKKT